MARQIFGIDFGTTNSCLAVMESGGPRVIEIEGQPLVPSVVSLDRESGQFIVGRRALNRLVLEPERTVRSIKRRMGGKEPLTLGERALLPEEIAAEILRYLKEEGERALGQEVRQVVITVPAYFADAQRRATIAAGELAGLDVVRILNEPTAAALLYDRVRTRGASATGAREGQVSDQEPQRILVYDLGGGTFDVSVVEMAGELNEVRASCGNTELGGDDFDGRLVDYLLLELRKSHNCDLSKEPRALARIHQAAEKAKIDLSSRPYARILEEALHGGVHLDHELARSTLEELIQELLDKTLVELEQALEEARLDVGQIDRVVLVGGSTHIPRVHELLAERVDCPVEHAIDPALCVGLGAAVQGAVLGGQVFDQILVDVAPHSLGVKTADNADLGSLALGLEEADCFSPIIRRNTQIPATRSEVYVTVFDGQSAVLLEVYQGESPRCSENTRIGRFLLELDPAPAGSRVVVEFAYDLDGVIHVVVEQKGKGRRREVTLNTRRREVSSTEGEARDVAAVDNYIIRKARTLGEALPAGEMRDRLIAAALAYEVALTAEEGDPDEVDRLEETLLELLEEAEAVESGAEGGP